MDGWMGGWVGGWVGVKAVLRIAYSNQKWRIGTILLVQQLSTPKVAAGMHSQNSTIHFTVCGKLQIA
jgi:hypothetical protein